MIIKRAFLSLSILLLGCTFSFKAKANSCAQVISDKNANNLENLLRTNKVAYYVLQSGDRQVPVILVNKSTIEKVKPILQRSIGFQTMSKAGWPNDHGSFRYGEYLIDAFLAGQRQVGEINETGLSWKTAQDSAFFLDKIADIIGEAAVFVSPEEMKVVDFYQRVRRSAFYRVPFRMGDQSIYRKFDNVVDECGAYCFEFSHSRRLDTHISAIERRLEALDPQSVVRNTKSAEIADYVNRVQILMKSATIHDVNFMSDRVLTRDELKPIMQKFVPENLSARQKELFLGYLVSLRAIRDMAQFVEPFQNYTTDPMSFLTTPRVDAILVWDPNAKESQFTDATYSGRAQSFSIPRGILP